MRKEIVILFMVPYSEHNKYEVKLVKDEPHIEFVLNGESALGDLGLSRHEKLSVVISPIVLLLLIPVQDNRPLKMPKLSFLLL